MIKKKNLKFSKMKPKTAKIMGFVLCQPNRKYKGRFMERKLWSEFTATIGRGQGSLASGLNRGFLWVWDRQ